MVSMVSSLVHVAMWLSAEIQYHIGQRE